MTSKATKKLWKLYRALPEEIQKLAKKTYIQFKKDPYYQSLHFKRIHSSKPIYSVRITKEYRAIGVVEEDRIIWFWIGSHSDYDRLLKNL